MNKKNLLLILVILLIPVSLSLKAQQDVLIDTSNFYSKCSIIAEFHNTLDSVYGQYNSALTIKGIVIIDSMKYIVAADARPYRYLFFTTEDGGENWELTSNIEIYEPFWPNTAPIIKDFVMSKNGVGVLTTHYIHAISQHTMLSDSGFIWRTTDFGKHWDYLQTGFIVLMNNLVLDNKGNFYFKGRYYDSDLKHYNDTSYIVKSDDNGLTWKPYIISLKASILYLMIPDSACMYYILSPDGSNTNFLLKTEDFGMHWDTLELNLNLNVSSRINFADKDNGWFLDFQRQELPDDSSVITLKILKTIDGGENWNLQYQKIQGIGKFGTAPMFENFIIYNKNIAILPPSGAGWTFMTIDGGNNWFVIDDKLIFSFTNRGAFASDKKVILGKEYLSDRELQQLEFNIPTLVNYMPKNEGESLLYPNPVKRGESINLYIAKDNIYRAEIKIFDINGRFIAEFNNSNVKLSGNKVSVDNINIPAGVYLVQPIINKIDFKTRKLILIE
jgi:photosystem II stability/assembly factor-like uncharacterized protein